MQRVISALQCFENLEKAPISICQNRTLSAFSPIPCRLSTSPRLRLVAERVRLKVEDRKIEAGNRPPRTLIEESTSYLHGTYSVKRRSRQQHRIVPSFVARRIAKNARVTRNITGSGIHIHANKIMISVQP